VPVTPPGAEDDPAPPILVNIGDLLSYWTNGLLRSTVHRVVFPSSSSASEGGGGLLLDGESDSEPRYSIAFFCHPVGTTTLGPVPSERVKAHVPTDGAEWAARGANPDVERKAITADEHLQMRLRATYLQMYDGEEK
jgi:isopenicillin N synthase-like dioxygenase